MMKSSDKACIPHEVVSLMVEEELAPAQAWRVHLEIPIDEAARRIDVSVKVYHLLETTQNLPADTRQLVAAALGIQPEQLDV